MRSSRGSRGSRGARFSRGSVFSGAGAGVSWCTSETFAVAGCSERSARGLRSRLGRSSGSATLGLPLSFSLLSASAALTSPIPAVLVEATSVLNPPLRRRPRGFLEASVLGV